MATVDIPFAHARPGITEIDPSCAGHGGEHQLTCCGCGCHLTFRQGGRQPINIYVSGPGLPADGLYIGVCFSSPDDAAWLVRELNGEGRDETD